MDKVLEYFKYKYESLSLDKDNIVQSYSSVMEEINLVKYGVGIYNRSESAVIRLSGKDVLDFLQRISTNDVLTLESFHYITTLFTNEKGRLIDRTALVKFEEDYFLVGGKKNDAVLERWINKYIITEDVKNENYTGKYLILDIIGPQAEAYLTLICGKDVDDLDNNKLHKIDIENTQAYLLKRKAGSGEDLYWLICEIEFAQGIFEYLLSHKSVFDLSMVGENAFDYYRVINKVPKNPNEINDNFNPHEVGLINEVSFKKGCYIGQEVIARLETYDKVQKKIKKVRINEANNIEVPFELYDNNGLEIGVLTTLIKSNENNYYEGLAFIRNAYENKNFISIKLESGEIIGMKVLD